MDKIISESIKQVLKENYKDFDGYDNDLDYDSVYEEACHFIATQNPKIMSWTGIAKAIGFQLKTIGPNDMETLKDAIQDAMADTE